MKTKNQTEHPLLELAVTSAANEDGISPAGAKEISETARNKAWSPLEVWRTRVKVSTQISRTDLTPIQR